MLRKCVPRHRASSAFRRARRRDARPLQSSLVSRARCAPPHGSVYRAPGKSRRANSSPSPSRHEPSRHAININVRDRIRGTVTNDSFKSLSHSWRHCRFQPSNFRYFQPRRPQEPGNLRSIRWILSKCCKCQRTKLLHRRQIYI